MTAETLPPHRIVNGEIVLLTAEEIADLEAEWAAVAVEAAARALDALRAERTARLTACDWTQLPDAPLTPEQRTAWAAYRQALRDLPETYAHDPAAVVWPAMPGA